MLTIVNGSTVEMRGLSGDTKPLNSIDPQTGEVIHNVANGAIIFEEDTGDVYMFDATNNR